MAVSIVFNTATAAGLAELNEFMKSRSYLVGFSATQSDVALIAAIGSAPDKAKYPYLARYYAHIASLSDAAKAKLAAGVSVVAGGATAAASASGAGADDDDDDDEDDDDDMFGDDDSDEDDILAIKAKQAQAAAAKAGKTKKKKIEKTSVVWDIKPADTEVDLDDIEAKIRAIEMPGLVWGMEFKKSPVAYGIFKLVISAVCEDEKTSIQDIEDEIESWEEVGSLDQLDMQKVT